MTDVIPYSLAFSNVSAASFFNSFTSSNTVYGDGKLKYFTVFCICSFITLQISLNFFFASCSASLAAASAAIVSGLFSITVFAR